MPVVLNYVFARHAGELDTYAAIVARQRETGAIYGPAMNGTGMRYKLEQFRQTRPDVVVIGSSSTLQYRREFFNAPFINAGGSVHALNEGRAVLEKLFDVHKPKLVYMGIDFFWFNDNVFQPGVFDSFETDETQFTRDKATQPTSWLLEGKISPSSYLDVLLGRRPRDIVYDRDVIGVRALTNTGGTLPDGSYLYTSEFTGRVASMDAKFKDTFARVRTGTGRMQYGTHFSPERFKIFEETVEVARRNGVRLIVVMAPVAPTVSALLDKRPADYGFRYELDAALRRVPGIEYYWFPDMRKLGSSDCEFIDGLHPGQIAVSRILLEILRRNPKSALAEYLSVSKLKSAVEAYAGHEIWPEGLKLDATSPEVDHLKLGCAK